MGNITQTVTVKIDNKDTQEQKQKQSASDGIDDDLTTVAETSKKTKLVKDVK